MDPESQLKSRGCVASNSIEIVPGLQADSDSDHRMVLNALNVKLQPPSSIYPSSKARLGRRIDHLVAKGISHG